MPRGREHISFTTPFVFSSAFRDIFNRKQEDARRRLRGMCWCKKELPVCWMAMES